MASTYSTDLRLELIGSGEQSGVWGSTTNLNLGQLIEQAVAGVETIVVPSSDYPLVTFYGAVDEARSAVLILSSGAAANVYAPPSSKTYIIRNAGAYAITMYNSTVVGNTTAAGAGVVVSAGTTVTVFTDGSSFYTSGLPSGATTGTGSVVYSVSPALTGVPTAPTANAGTNTTQIATTAFALANGIPSGAILIWSGTALNIPSGWNLCDGTNGTPDLRNRFVVGAVGAGAGYAPGDTGGSANAVVVSHTHTATSVVTDPSHNHAITGYADNFGSGDGPLRTSLGSNSGTLFTNTSSTGVTVATTVASAGSSGTNANLPPYYALCYIMKA